MNINKENIQKIINITVKPTKPGRVFSLEASIKKRLTLRLFGQTLISNKSYEGKITNFIRSWTRIDPIKNSRWTKLLKNAFKQLTEADNQKIKQLPQEKQTQFYSFKHDDELDDAWANSNGLKALEAFISNEEAERENQEEHWTKDPKVVSQLSLFRHPEKSVDPGISLNLFSTLTSGSLSSQAYLDELLTYIEKYLIRQGVPNFKIQQMLVSWTRGLKVESALQDISTKGKNEKKRPEAIKELIDLAKKTTQMLAQLPTEETAVLFGGSAPHEADLNFSQLVKNDKTKKLNEFIKDKNYSHTIARGIIDTLVQEFERSSASFPDRSYTVIKNIFKQGLISSHLIACFSTSLFNGKPLWKKILLSPLELGRIVTEKVLDYTLSQYSQAISNAIPDTFWGEINKCVLESKTSEELKSLLIQKCENKLIAILEGFRSEALNSVTRIGSAIPPAVQGLLSLGGFGEIGLPEQPVWFKVKKERNGTFTLQVFATGSAGELHPKDSKKSGKFQIPLTYKGLTLEELDQDFLYNILSFRVSAIWEKQDSSALHEIYEYLLTSLNRAPEPVTEDSLVDLSELHEGNFGILQQTLKKEMNFDRSAEKLFYFNLRKQALLDMYVKLSKRPSLLTVPFVNSLDKAVDELSCESLELYNEKLINLEELKMVYATCWEAKELAKPVGNKAVEQVLPIEIQQIVSVFLMDSQVSSSYLDMLKYILIGISGEKMGDIVDNFSKELIQKKTSLQPKQNNEKIASHRHIETALKLYSWGKTAYRVSLIAVAIFARKHTLKGVVAYFASRFFVTAFTWCCPDASHKLARLRQRYIGYALSHLFFNKDQRDYLQSMGSSWEASILRSGELSLDLSKSKDSPHMRTFRHVKLDVENLPPLEYEDEVDANIFPIPKQVTITTANVEPFLEVLLMRLRGDGNDVEKRTYINQQLKNLPVPLKSEPDIWDQVEDVEKCIEKIGALALDISKIFSKGPECSIEANQQYIIGIYKCYAIIDKLARRCLHAHLEGFQSNPWALAFWSKNLKGRFLDLYTYQEMEKICHYFGIDLKHEYTDEEISSLASNSLFHRSEDSLFETALGKHYGYCELLGPDHIGSPAETDYLYNLLNDPMIRQKLEMVGLKDASLSDQIMALYKDNEPKCQDPSKEEVKKFNKLFATPSPTFRKSFLPLPFYFLRLINLLANKGLRSFRTNGLRTTNDYSIKEIASSHCIHTFFKHVPFINEWVKRDLTSKLRQIPITHQVVEKLGTYNFTQRKKLLNRRKPYDDEWMLRRREVYHTGFDENEITEALIDYIHHPHRRKQNEVVNRPPTFSEPRDIANGFFNCVIDSLNGNTIVPPKPSAFLNKFLSSEDKRNLEMIWSVKSEQVSRAISFFTKKMDLLKSDRFIFILDILLLESNLLYEQIKDHPEYSQTLADFFQNALKAFPKRSFPHVHLQLIRLGILVKMEVENIDPSLGSSFPDFRNLLLDKDWPNNADLSNGTYSTINERASLLILPYFAINPAKASPEIIKRAVQDICWYGKTHNPIYSNDMNYLRGEIITKWVPYISRTLDRVENENFRDQLLTSILVQRDELKTDNAQTLKWKGKYPNYYSGRFNINFNKYDCIEKGEEEHKIIIAKTLKEITGSDTVEFGSSKNEYATKGLINEQAIYITVQPNENHLENLQNDTLSFYKIIRGVKHFLVEDPDQDRQPHTSLWLSEANQLGMSTLCTFEENKLSGKTFLLRNGDSQKYRVIQGTVEQQENNLLEEINLNGKGHGLTLLSWFQPLSAIRFFCNSIDQSLIRKIRFTKFNLSFTTQKVDGEYRAICDDKEASGYYISKVQKSPLLTKYTSYLLLENSHKENKVIITFDSIISEFQSGLSQRFGSLQLTHLMKSFVNNNFDYKPDFYIYDMDSKGRLSSTNIEANFFLLIYHLAAKNTKETLHYLKCIENMGREEPFPIIFKKYITLISVAASLHNDEIFTRMSLRLEAILQENTLLHSDEQTPQSDDDIYSYISWGAVNINYNRWMKSKKYYPNLIIDEYQELFILNSQAEKSKFIIEKNFELDDEIKKILKKLGITELPEILIANPEIMSRYNFLKKKYLTAGEQRFANVQEFLQHYFLNGQSFTDIIQNIQNPKKTRQGAAVDPSIVHENNPIEVPNEFKDLEAILKEYIQNKIKRRTPLSLIEGLQELILDLDLNAKLEDVPLNTSEITPEVFTSYFHLYYRLSMQKIPESWVGNPEKEALFNLKVEKWKRISFILKRNLHKKGLKHLAELLQRITKDPKGFPEPKAIESIYRRLWQKGSSYNLVFITLYRLDNDQTKLKILETIKEDAILKTLAKTLESKCKGLRYLENFPVLKTFIKQQVYSAIKTNLDYCIFPVANRLIPRQEKDESARPEGVIVHARPIGLGALPYLMRAFKAAQKVYEANKQIEKERQEIEKKKVVQETPLANGLQDVLHQEDLKLSVTLDHFFQDNFRKKDIPPGRINPIKKIRSPNLAPLYKKSFIKMQKSVKDYYKRTQEGESWELKSYEHLFILKTQLKKASQSLSTHIKTEKDQILSFLNHTKKEERPDEEVLPEMIKKRTQKWRSSKITSNEDFNLILEAFLYGDYQKVLKVYSITEDKIPKLEEMLFSYLIKSTKLHQMQRSLESVEKLQKTPMQKKDEFETRLKQLVFELRRQRAYSFHGPSTRLIKGYLIFEYKTQKMLWDKQVKQLERMLLGPYARVVLELIMGSGKTFFGIPISDFFAADGDQMVIDILPTALAKEAMAQNSKQGRKVFKQPSSTMKMNRQKQMGVKQLWGFLRMFQRTINNKEKLQSTKEDFQSCELKFVESVYNKLEEITDKTPSEQELSSYMQLLKIIRKKGKGNIDESQQAFKQNDELNYPLGQKKHLEKTFLDIIQECAKKLVHLPEVNKILNVKENQQAYVKEETYKKEVLPQLARELSFYVPFNVTNENREAFIQYISGTSETIPEFVLQHPLKSEIGLMKGLLSKIIPKTCLEDRFIGVEYGPSMENNGEYARPYAGNENPIETSTIQNPFEAVIKTFLMFLQRRLDYNQKWKLIDLLVEQAKLEQKRTGLPFEQTQTANLFRSWCEKKSINLQLSHCVGIIEFENLLKIFKMFDKEDDAVLYYARYCVAPKVEYFDISIKSDSQNFASMFASFYSDTGTPNKNGVFPQGTQVLWDQGTLGESLDLLSKKCNSPESIVEIQGDKPSSALKNILTFIDSHRKISAIIDEGVVLQGLKNEKVAEEILSYIKKSRPDLDAVVFYTSDKKLVIWEKDSKTFKPLEQSKIPPERRLTYYDNNHTFGADIAQPFDGEAFVTVGKNTDTIRLSQAIWRMRGLKTAKQGLYLGFVNTVSKLISPIKPNVRQIIQFCRTNEARVSSIENYFSDCQKISNVIRRAVLDKMIFAPNVKTMLKYAREFLSVLISKREEDPFVVYGLPVQKVGPLEALTLLKKAKYALIENSNSFTDKEKLKIKKQLNAIKQECYPEEVEVSKVDGQLVVAQDDLGRTQQMEQNQNLDQAQEQDVEQDMQRENNLEQEQNAQRNNEPTDPNLGSKFRSEPAQWNETYDYFGTLDWLKPNASTLLSDQKTVGIYGLSDLMKTAENEEISSIAETFHGRLFCTNNFVGILENDELSGLSSPRQKPVRELLVIQNTDTRGNKNIHTVALDEDDVIFWKKKLRENRRRNYVPNPNIKISLFDVGSNSPIATGKNPLTLNETRENKILKRHVTLWKFFNGECTYSSSQIQILDRWMRFHDRRKMKNAFLEMNKQRTLQRFDGSTLEPLLVDV